MTGLMSSVRAEMIPWYEALTQPILGMPRAQPFLALKRVLLRVLGAKLGKRVMIYPGVWIVPISRRLTIGDDVDLSRGVMITTPGRVNIGDRVLLGYNAKILSTNHNIPNGRGRVFGAGHTSAPVTIERDAWIGSNAIVLPGVTVGEGAIVAAGAIVTKSVAPYMICAGVPAVVIGERAEDDGLVKRRVT